MYLLVLYSNFNFFISVFSLHEGQLYSLKYSFISFIINYLTLKKVTKYLNRKIDIFMNSYIKLLIN